MKNLVLTIASVFALSTSLFAQGHKIQTLTPGDKIPGADISMKSVGGNATTLKAQEGKNGLLVMFSCNTCPYVVRNQPVTNATIKYAKEHNINMVVINSNENQRSDEDSYAAMGKYAKEQGYTVPYLLDDKAAVADMFGATHTPEIFLFNKDGKLVYKGAMNDNPSDPASAKHIYINDAIDNLVAGKTINPNTTKSVGCGIKRI